MKSPFLKYAFVLHLTTAWLLTCTLTIAAPGESTLEPGAIWPDQNGVHINAHGGGILLHEGIYYWFGEHKIAGPAGNTAQVGVHVYSSTNLTHWNDEGIALKVADEPDSDIVKGCVLERPKVIYNAKTGKFVMWFHLELKGVGYSAARSGVAVAEQVTGPYQFIKSFRPNAGTWPINAPDEMKRELSSAEAQAIDQLKLAGGPVPNYPLDKIFRRDFAGGQMARDMTLFVDDDKSAYHIYSSEENGCLHISQLTPDYLAPAGKYVRVFPGRFHEAPAIFKHHDKYYLITSGCTGWAPNAARSAVADSIWGPWRELGNPCVGSKEQTNVTFHSQATFVLPVPGNPNAFIFMGDRWQPQNPIDGRYIWLPLRVVDGRPQIEWRDRWDLERPGK